MARKYAQTPTSLWDRSGTHVRLTIIGQWVHHLLTSQPDISACGMLPLLVRRWAGLAADASDDAICSGLKELEAAGRIVVDEDTMELLVVSFVSDDGGFTNPRRLPSIRDAANAVSSRRIVRALAVEFERLEVGHQWRGQASTECLSEGNPHPNADGADGSSDRPTGEVLPHDSSGVPHDENPQVDSHSIPKDESTEWLSAEERRVPQPTTHNPQPTTHALPASDDDPALFDADAPVAATRRRSVSERVAYDHNTDPDFAEFWAVVAAKSGKPSAYREWKKALKKSGVTKEMLVEQMAAYRDWVQRTNATHVKYPQGWLADERWNDRLPSGPTTQRGPYQNSPDDDYDSWKRGPQ